MAVHVFTDEELEGLRRFPVIGRAHSENINFFGGIDVDVKGELAQLGPTGYRPLRARYPLLTSRARRRPPGQRNRPSASRWGHKVRSMCVSARTRQGWRRGAPPTRRRIPKMSAQQMAVPRIGWLTDTAAPYRWAVWEHLARHAQLTLFVLEKGGRSGGRRVPEWPAHSDASISVGDVSFPIKTVPTVRLPAAGRQIRLPMWPGDLPRGGVDALVLEGWDSPAYWLAAGLGRAAGARLVGFWEPTLATHAFRRGLLPWAQRRFFRGLDAAIVPGEAAKRALMAMGVHESKIHIGFNPVHVAGIHAAAAGAQRAAAPAPGHCFLYLGPLTARKNVSALLEAFWLLGNPRDTLTIAGSGPLREELEELRDLLGLGGRVAFVGAVPYDRVPEVLAGHHTLVLPSVQEAWGTAVEEALAVGLHAVVSRACGVAESVNGMRGVFLADPVGSGIATAMRVSRQCWEGPVAEPEILARTPVAFAEAVLRAATGGSVR
ncbi:glycosyltransferase family 4 protein [Sinomonas sp. G460-2]|uniref:glycosyltransferase family 4 protein n=1 Tax=Sinomonas sp. G460-2 TaxID=3393464 RepID=UPI0039EE1464